MADINALIAQYANQVTPTTSVAGTKAASVASAAAEKTSSLPGTAEMYKISVGALSGNGVNTISQMEKDLRAMDPTQLRTKHGEQADELLAGQVNATQRVMADASRGRSGLEVIGDTATGAWSGLTGSLASIGVLGAGILNPNLGIGAAQVAQQNSEALQASQSDALAGRRRVNAVEQALDTRDTTAQFNAEKGDGELMASLRRIGRDVSNTIKNAAHSDVLLADGVAQGVGSLLAAGPVSKGIAAFGAGTKVATPAAIGLMEGGGAYQQTANEVATMPFEQLAKTSPDYRSLVAGGMAPEDARIRIASNAGLQAAATQAPLAAAAGTLVSKFEGAPGNLLRVPSLGSAAGNLVRETVEEGIQSGTGQLSQNAALQANADQTKSLSEGVGEQVGLGALYGLGSAGAVQAPGAAGRASLALARATGQAVVAGTAAALSPLMKAGAETQAANEKASPVADAKIAEQAKSVIPPVGAPIPTVPEETAVAATAAPPATEAAPQPAATPVSTYVQDLTNLFQTKGADLVAAGSLNPALAPVVEGANNLIEVMQGLAAVTKMDSAPEAAKLDAATTLQRYLDGLTDALNQEPEALAALAPEHAVSQYAASLRALAQALEASPTMKRARAQMQKLAETANESGLIQPVTEESLATPEGQRNVQNIVATAELAPAKANPEAINQVLAHIDSGKLQLTPAQIASLKTVKTLLDTAKADAAERERLGLRPLDVVSGQVTTDKEGAGNKQSALQHANGIRTAYRAGDRDLAAARLTDFLKFAQHMQNKVAALNAVLASGKFGKDNGIGYEALDPSTREWYTVPDGVQGLGLTPGQAKSVEFAQRVGVEAETLAAIANGLVDAYPDLQLSHVQAVSLAPALKSGTAQQVAQQFARQSQAAKSSLDDAAPAGTRSKPEVSKAAGSPSETKTKEAESVPPQSTEQAPVEATPVQQPVTESEPTAAQSKAESTSDPAPKAEVPSQEASTPSADEPARKGLAAVFPNLIGSVDKAATGLKNWFLTSFQLPKEAISRTGLDDPDTELPLAMIREALSSEQAFRDFVANDGELGKTYSPEVAQVYQRYLQVTETIAQHMRDNLQAYLNKEVPVGEDTRTAEEKKAKVKDTRPRASRLAQLLEGNELINRQRNGKLVNLLEDDDKGGLQYNERLLQNAILAGFQWMISANESDSHLDEKGAAQILGIDQDMVTEDQIRVLDQGTGVIEAQQALARKIQSYWGVTPDRNAVDGYAKGIPLAMAAEVLDALNAQGGLQVLTLSFDQFGTLLETSLDGQVQGEKWDQRSDIVKTPQRVLLSQDLAERLKPLQEFPTAIEEAILVEPEEVRYFGKPPKKVADTQMNNPVVDNTPEQKAAIRKNQNTPYYVHQPMARLFMAMGKSQVVELFGAGNLKGRELNSSHRKTLEGRNQSISSAYDALEGLMVEARNRADAAGVEIDQLPIHYAFNMSRVGRLQMLGKFNPQASKLMREAVLPTRSTLDLTTEAHRDLFLLGIAQALGEKVHKQPRATSVANALAQLNGKLAPVVEALRDWHGQGMDQAIDKNLVGLLKSSLGSNLSPVAVMALMEYARALNSSAEGNREFTTPLYVEADGVTNGPITAMAILTPGEFTPQWKDNIARGGLYLNQPVSTVNEYMAEEGSKDLYQATTDRLKLHLERLTRDLGRQKDQGPREQMRALMRFMDAFLPGLSTDEEGNIKGELDRKLAKNPLTITIYGSGENGIAAKVIQQMMDEIYALMSGAAERRAKDNTLSPGQAMFPNLDPEAAEAKFEVFANGFKALTSQVIKVNRKGEYYMQPAEDYRARSSINFKTFTLQPKELQAMISNVRTLYVEPLSAGISDTLGPQLFQATKQLQKAVQVQSIVLQHAFTGAINLALERKRDEDPTWREGDFLSQAEQREILDQLAYLSPIIKTVDQEFFVAGSQSTDLAGVESFGSSLNDKMRTPAFVYAPQDAGVGGIPYLNIGTGDGRMIQLISTVFKNLNGFLPVFDGINFPLDKVEEYSRHANDAVWRTWQGNTLAAVHKSYAAFMQNVTLKDLYEDPALLKDLAKATLGAKAAEEATPEQVYAAMESTEASLLMFSRQVEARHRALKSVQVRVDQMASAESPYLNQGKYLTGLSDAETLQILNERYRHELQKLNQGEQSTFAALATEVVAPVATPKADSYSGKGINVLAKSLAMPKELLSLVQGLLKQVPGLTVLKGAKDSLPAVGTAPAGWDGLYVPERQHILLATDNPEVLAHEVVHAATYQTILDVLDGVPVATEVKDAVTRLQVLAEQFLSLDLDNASPELEQAYVQARMAMEAAGDNQAAVLNEFMAYALTNQALIDKLKGEQAHPLVRLTQKAIQLIKRLVFGARAPIGKVGNDFFSNLKFNTLIVASAQPSASAMAGNTALAHTPAYGTDNRLTRLSQGFDNLVGRYVGKQTSSAAFERHGKAQVAMAMAANATNRAIAHGFPMTLQAKTVFRQIVAALATEAHLDANALARVEDLYRHVTKTLTVEDLMDPQAPDVGAERYRAQQRYNTLLGNYGTDRDASDRSTLLSVFLGLVMVDDELRGVLQKMTKPKGAPKSWDTLDNVLTSAGTTVMEALSERMSGEGQSTDVKAALDALTARVLDTAQERESALEQAMGVVGAQTDRANTKTVELLEAASASVVKAADKVSANTNSKVVKAVADAAKLTAQLITETGAEQAAEGIMAGLNRVKLWVPIHEIIGDLVGRTLSNAGIYDMIKLVKSHISQDRQQYREHLPTIIADKFSRKLTEREWSSLFHGLAKTDLAGLYTTFTADEVRKLLTDRRALAREIRRAESALSQQNPRKWLEVQAKSKQLANYMVTGEVGHNLLRNAYTVSRLFGGSGNPGVDESYQQTVDNLVTFYALEQQPDGVKNDLVSLAQSEKDGVDFALAYLAGQRIDEINKAGSSAKALVNHYKGHIPSEASSGVSLIVAPDSEFAKLAERSFVRVGSYAGSSVETHKEPWGYYFAPVSGRAPYNQGILQNVRQTAGGVDVMTGYTLGTMTAGRITNQVDVARIARRYANEANQGEPLLPVYDDKGKIVAFERSVDPQQTARLERDTHLAKMIGVWRGRQVEEAKAQHFNTVLIDSLHKMYQTDVAKGKAAEYVNLFGQLDDPILADAVGLITPEVRRHIESLFGDDGFPVRKDMLADAMGYRNATIGDAWTGNSRWSPAFQDKVKTAAMGIFGNAAYQRLVNAEKILQNYVSDARVVIVVKSVVVPLTNLIGNIYQLAGRGVPLAHIFRGLPKKTAEVDAYVKSRLRQLEAEAELRAVAGDIVAERRLKTELASIADAHRRLSIWPLIEAGEFSAISDAGISRDEILLSEGRLHAYMEALAAKLPPGLQTAGRYALITKDTALFQGLQKAVEYGDFLAKAILYDDLTKRQGRSQEHALARVTEEFVNYDRLPGRFRGYLESTGLLWFYNFKIRAAKVALSMIRNNPVHALLAGLAPTPTWFGDVGTPLGDNFFTQLGEGGLSHSVGLGQALHAPMMNPWVNLVD